MTWIESFLIGTNTSPSYIYLLFVSESYVPQCDFILNNINRFRNEILSQFVHVHYVRIYKYLTNTKVLRDKWKNMSLGKIDDPKCAMNFLELFL